MKPGTHGFAVQCTTIKLTGSLFQDAVMVLFPGWWPLYCVLRLHLTTELAIGFLIGLSVLHLMSIKNALKVFLCNTWAKRPWRHLCWHLLVIVSPEGIEHHGARLGNSHWLSGCQTRFFTTDLGYKGAHQGPKGDIKSLLKKRSLVKWSCSGNFLMVKACNMVGWSVDYLVDQNLSSEPRR